MSSFNAKRIASGARLCLAGLAGAALTLSQSASADIINYCVKVHTSDVTYAGTDNHIDLTMYGDGGSKKIRLKGSHERDDHDDYHYPLDDFGVVNRITLDVNGQLADKWSVHYVRIYRDAECSRSGDADGWSEFIISRELDYDPVDFNATSQEAPKVTVSPSGQVRVNKERITVINYADNPGSVDREVMQFTESWSRVDAVSVSSEQTDTIGAGLTVSYTSPETVAGQFGAEASVSWERAISEAREESTEKMSASEYNWAFVAPARTFVMRRVTFEVPYAEQIYKSSRGASFAIRKVGAQIRPVGGAGDFIEIPTRDEAGAVVPISLKVLEADWFDALDPSEVSDLRRRHLNKWLENGWVYAGNAPPGPNDAPTPPPNPPATPEPENPPVANPVPPPAAPIPQGALTTEGVTGANLRRAEFAQGWFEQGGSGTWVEYGADGQARFTFQELGRDEWSVYIRDASRGMALQLDVYRKMIGITGNGDLYAITAAKRIAPSGGSSKASYSSEGVNGGNLNRVTIGDGENWVDNGNGTWTEYNAAGEARFAFTETGRDEWSVYVRDEGRNLGLQFDVHRKMIGLSLNGGAFQDQWGMSSAERRN